MKKNFCFGIIISGIFVFLIVYRLDFKELGTALKSASYIFLIPIFLLFVLNLLIRSLRWRYLIKPVKKIRVKSLFSATSIGFMANMVLPVRMGEFVRAFVLAYKEKISKSASFATIVVERLFDGFTVLSILVLILTFVNFPEEMGFIGRNLKTAGYLSFIFYLFILGILIFLRLDKSRVIRWFRTIFFFLPERLLNRFLQILDSFSSGLQILEGGRQFFPIIFLSALLWLTVVIVNYIVFVSFHLNLPLYAPFFLVVMQAIGVMIPSSPGFIGTFHAASVIGLAFFGVSKEVALSAAIVMHAAFFIPIVTLGFIFLWTEHISFRELRDIKDERLTED